MSHLSVKNSQFYFLKNLNLFVFFYNNVTVALRIFFKNYILYESDNRVHKTTRDLNYEIGIDFIFKTTLK